MNLDLTGKETAALLRALDGIIDGDSYFLSTPIKTVRAIRPKTGSERFRRASVATTQALRTAKREDTA
jgi:hypothetical protein